VIRAALLLLPFLVCCRSSDDPYGGEGPERLLDVEQSGTGLAPYEGGFAVRMDDTWRSNRSIPEGIRTRIAAGNEWLVLREPVVFSGAARWIASGKTPFEPESIEIKAAHDRRDDELGRDPPLRPALLVIRGTFAESPDESALGIEQPTGLSIEELGLAGGIKAVKSEADRVALGRGVETAMRLVTGHIGTDVGQSSFDWITTFRDGKKVPDAEWIAAIDQGVDARRPYRAIVRRYRASVEPRETWFSVPLNVVLLCSQMNLERDGNGRIGWEWEGFWLGRLARPEPEPAAPPPPTVRVVYAEFRSSKDQRRGGDYLSTVFNPVTRTGRTALEELQRRAAAAFLPGKD